MKKHILFVIGIAAVLMLVEDRAQACTCDLPDVNPTLKKEVDRALKESRAVFSGEVIEVTRTPETYFVTVKFRVDTSWKGHVAKEITVSTGRGGGDCGFPFEIGERYLVYAYGSQETSLATNICQRTTRAAAVTEEIKLLGKGKRVAVKVSSDP